MDIEKIVATELVVHNLECVCDKNKDTVSENQLAKLTNQSAFCLRGNIIKIQNKKRLEQEKEIFQLRAQLHEIQQKQTPPPDICIINITQTSNENTEGTLFKSPITLLD